MTKFVVDASIVLAWCFEDEHNPFAEHVLQELRESIAIVPAVWAFEVANALVVADRRRRVAESKVRDFLLSLAELPIQLDRTGSTMIALFDLSRRAKISAYDAAYLELALRQQIPLATADRQLRAAAVAVNAAVLDA